MLIEQVKKDFYFLRDEVLALLIFGSCIEGKAGKKSDVDICIVAPGKNAKDLLKEVFANVDVAGKKYDVHVFEELPLYMKISIIEKHLVVFGDKFSLGNIFTFSERSGTTRNTGRN